MWKKNFLELYVHLKSSLDMGFNVPFEWHQANFQVKSIFEWQSLNDFGFYDAFNQQLFDVFVT